MTHWTVGKFERRFNNILLTLFKRPLQNEVVNYCSYVYSFGKTYPAADQQVISSKLKPKSNYLRYKMYFYT